MLGFVEIEGLFGRVVLVAGPESLLAERAVDELVRQALIERPGASVNRLSASELDAGRLAEVTGGSLFASDTIVVVTELADLPQDLFDDVASFATQRNDDLVLVLVHPGGTKGKGLLDRLKKAKVPTRDCPTIKVWELPQFAVAEASLLGARLETPTAIVLVEAVGGDARAVAGAVRQLVADADDRHISEADVRRYFAGRADITSFTVADHVMSGRRNEALGALRWALETGVPPVLVTSALASSLRSQGRYSDLAGARLRDQEVAQRIGVPPWKVKDVARHAREWTPRGLATALQFVARADAAVKGAQSDPAFALEQLVIGVAEQRGRRPESGMGR